MPTPKPEIVGETFDGIKILKPVTRPTSFTVAEIRQTIDEVLRDHYERTNDDTGRTQPDTNGEAAL